MSTELFVVILLLLGGIVLDFAALCWGADSRRLDPQAYALNAR